MAVVSCRSATHCCAPLGNLPSSQAARLGFVIASALVPAVTLPDSSTFPMPVRISPRNPGRCSCIRRSYPLTSPTAAVATVNPNMYAP